MVSGKITITNPTGLHTRPGTDFVHLAQKFESEITLKKGDKEASAKSIIKVLKIGISQGDEIELVAEGSDEQNALDALLDYIKNLKE